MIKKFTCFFAFVMLLNYEAYSQCAVSAGIDTLICESTTGVQLQYASSEGGTGVIWNTSGTGMFNNINDLNPQYIPSAADLANGSVVLEITSVGCGPVSDQMLITFVDAPTVYAGPDQTFCTNINSVTVNANVEKATGVLWTSSGTGIFNPVANTLNVNYIPSAADKANGGATLTVTSTGNGSCPSVADQMMVTFVQAPTIFAGYDMTICPGSNITTSASMTNATGVMWSGGTGTFNSPTSLITTYTPSTMEAAGGSVSLTITTTGNPLCPTVSDEVALTINPAPSVEAGPNKAGNKQCRKCDVVYLRNRGFRECEFFKYKLYSLGSRPCQRTCNTLPYNVRHLYFIRLPDINRQSPGL